MFPVYMFESVKWRYERRLVIPIPNKSNTSLQLEKKITTLQRNRRWNQSFSGDQQWMAAEMFFGADPLWVDVFLLLNLDRCISSFKYFLLGNFTLTKLGKHQIPILKQCATKKWKKVEGKTKPPTLLNIRICNGLKWPFGSVCHGTSWGKKINNMEFEDVQSDHPNDMWRLLISCEKKRWWRFFTLWNISLWMFPKIVGFPPKSSIFIRFSIINHPVWGSRPYFRKHPYIFGCSWMPVTTSIMTFLPIPIKSSFAMNQHPAEIFR